MTNPISNLQSPLDTLAQNLEQGDLVIQRTMNLVDSFASQTCDEFSQGDYGPLCPSHRTREEIKEALEALVLSAVKAKTPLLPTAEPDWDEILTQAELATGIKVERHTYSIIMREVRHWLYERSQQDGSAANKEAAQ